MSWVRLDDQIVHHPKTVAAGNEAFGAWVRMLAHACAYLTDGFVAQPVALTLVGSKRRLLDQLVAVGFLEKVDGGYRIHDFADWNPSAEQVREERRQKSEAKAAAGRLGGKRSGEARRSKPEADAKQNRSNSEANGQANAKRNEAPSPSPSLSAAEAAAGSSGASGRTLVHQVVDLLRDRLGAMYRTIPDPYGAATTLLTAARSDAPDAPDRLAVIGLAASIVADAKGLRGNPTGLLKTKVEGLVDRQAFDLAIEQANAPKPEAIDTSVDLDIAYEIERAEQLRAGGRRR